MVFARWKTRMRTCRSSRRTTIGVSDALPKTRDDPYRTLLKQDHLDDVFIWQEERTVTSQIRVNHKRTMRHLELETTEEAKAAAYKRVTVAEYEDGCASNRSQSVTLDARPFHKNGCVTHGAIGQSKPVSDALTETRKRQRRKEEVLVKSAKTKREKHIVRQRFAGPLGLWAMCAPSPHADVFSSNPRLASR